MPIHAFVSPRADALLPQLVSRLQEMPDDPFRREIIVVPSAVYRDWLTEQLAERLKCPDGRPGVVGNVEFLLPGDFYLLVENNSGTSHSWPSFPDQLTVACHIFVLMSEHPLLVPSYGDTTDRMALAIKAAQLFERYAIDRPDMLSAWASGLSTDGDAPLPQRHVWQFELWNLLRERLGDVSDSLITSDSHGVADVKSTQSQLVGRLSLFGLEVLSPRAVRALSSLAATEDVVLFGTLPSRHVVTVGKDLADKLQQPGNHKREIFADFVDPRHPLLRTWASSAYETAALLWCVTSDVLFVEAEHSPNLLGAFQADLSCAAELDAVEPGSPVTDGSIQVHRCHGLIRQVEVARDALLHILNDDPTITLRDVLVVAPGIDQIAALIPPIFEIQVSSSFASQHPVRLSTALLDGSSVDSSDVSQIVLSLLRLAGSRCTRSEVKSLFNIHAVRAALGLDEESLVKIDRWLEQIDVRWGISTKQRELVGYPADFKQGSWAWAAERLVAGAFVQAPAPVELAHGISPYDDIGTGDLDTLVHFVSLLSLLEKFQEFGSMSRPISDWTSELSQVVKYLLPNEEEFADDLDDANKVIAKLHELSQVTGQLPLSSRELQALLSDQFRDRRTPVRRWGDVVRVGSLARMRGVPARVIVILGLDDAALVTGSTDGDDILGESPRIGERDRRADERLALLATVAAVHEHLVVTAEGYTVTSNTDVAPSIPQTELLEAVQKTVRSSSLDSSQVSRPLVVSHSRQLAHPVNLGVSINRKEPSIHDFLGAPWTFDQSAAVLARASLQATIGENEIADLHLPPIASGEQDAEIRISDLVDAVRRPLRVLIRNRLGVVFRESEGAPAEDMSLWPDALERSALGREWISLRLAGVQDDEVSRRLGLMGRLPAGQLGVALIAELQSEINAMIEKSGGDPTSSEALAIDLEVGESRIRDRVVLIDGEIRVVDYAKHHPSRKAEPWLQLAAAVQQLDGRDVIARLVTRSNTKDKDESTPVVTVLRIFGANESERMKSAERVLAHVNRLRQLAMRKVIPLFDRTVWALIAEVSPSALKTDYERDCERPEYRWSGYIPDLSELTEQTSREQGAEAMDNENFRELADQLAACLRATTIVEEEGVE